ncbi:MAG: Ger(x)C family spore germination C-terminal domain-containing protein [Oscillospiraceae bacterium]|nr:Ger(x)C family spore germination C-terminal domain-containing protein [Oscillospiraceae bacterium]
MSRRMIQSLTLLLVCSLLSGCSAGRSIYSNFRSLEDMRLVETLGFDLDGSGITLSAAVGSGADAEPTVLRHRDFSILAAMERMQDYADKGQLFFAHTQYILLGRAAAENGVGALFDFVERDVHTRLESMLFLLEDGDAEALITDAGGESGITGTLASLEQEAQFRMSGHAFSLRETAVALSEYGAALICMLRTAALSDGGAPDAEGQTAVPAGYGVLKGGALVGTLDNAEAEITSLLLGETGSLRRGVPGDADSAVILSLEGVGAELSPTWNADGTPGAVTVRLSLRGAVAELSADLALPEAALLEAEAETALTAEVCGVLARMQDLNADFLQLGRALRCSGGERFAALGPDWLQALRFDVRVDVTLDRSYDLERPVGMEGEVGA